jgi:glycosyltransferase involved in cell wall biosynthesis
MTDPSSGPSYTVTRLAQELGRLGERVSIKTLADSRGAYADDLAVDARDGVLERALGVSPALMRDIVAAARERVIIHGHGIWRPLNLMPLLLGPARPARVVWSPQGTLSEWSMRSKRALKAPFWTFLQKPSLRRCDCLHATSTLEYEEIRAVGLGGPVAIIPNGIDLPELEGSPQREKMVLYLGRIDPKKGIDLLLASWAEIAAEFTDWRLVVAGPMRGTHADDLRALAAALTVERVDFVGEALGREKAELYARASLFVLPSHSENFGMVIAEALMHGTPVVTTTGTPWRQVEDRGCGWCIALSRPALTQALAHALRQPAPTLRTMGGAGRRWMESDYAWLPIAAQMRALYAWLLGDGPRPECVVVN